MQHSNSFVDDEQWEKGIFRYNCRAKGRHWFRVVKARTMQSAVMTYYNNFTALETMIIEVAYNAKSHFYEIKKDGQLPVLKTLYKGD